MKVFKLFKKISNSFMKLNTWSKVALIIGIILVLLILANIYVKKKEGCPHRPKRERALAIDTRTT